MLDTIKVDKKATYYAPVRIFEEILRRELEKRNYRVALRGYHFAVSQIDSDDSYAALDAIDFSLVDKCGTVACYTLQVSHSILSNPVAMSRDIATAKNLRLSAAEKYTMQFRRNYSNQQLVLSATDFVKFIEKERKN